MNILMVCLGNICRSPLAEGILKHKAGLNGLKWRIDSAGTENFHVGESPHRLSQKIAREHGIDISHQRARQLTASDLQHYDKIYAMAPDVLEEMEYLIGKKSLNGKVDILRNEVSPGKNLPVPDPWYGGEKEFRQAYDLIDEACSKIIEKYKAQ